MVEYKNISQKIPEYSLGNPFFEPLLNPHHVKSWNGHNISAFKWDTGLKQGLNDEVG